MAEALAGADSAATQIASSARRVHDTRAGRLDLAADLAAHDENGRPDGFQARHSLTIRCADIAAAGVLPDRCSPSGRRPARGRGRLARGGRPVGATEAAREAAYADAVDRATHLAALAGAELGDVQDVVEGGAASGPVRVAMHGDPGRASFQPGETAVASSVTVTFQPR